MRFLCAEQLLDPTSHELFSPATKSEVAPAASAWDCVPCMQQLLDSNSLKLLSPATKSELHPAAKQLKVVSAARSSY